MKPFDLFEALRGAPLINRSRKRIVFFAYDAGAAEDSRIVARADGDAVSSHFYESGISYEGESNVDLFLADPSKVAS